MVLWTALSYTIMGMLRTSRASMLATSSMKSEPVVRFATFRVAGDKLVPDEITAILQTSPTTAYQKGEKVRFGPRSPETVGKTGVWFLSTDKVVLSQSLDDHLRYILKLAFFPGGDPLRTGMFRDVLKKKNLKAHLTIFVHGGKRPTLPPSFEAMLKTLPADVQIDFDTDE